MPSRATAAASSRRPAASSASERLRIARSTTTTSSMGAGVRGLCAKRLAHGGRKTPAVGSVAVDIGIVDRHLQSHRTAGTDCGAQRRYALVPGEAVRPGVVHRRHDRLVEDVAVEMDPKTVPRAAIAGQERQGFAGRSGGAEPMDLFAIDNQNVGRKLLTATAFAVCSITAREHGPAVLADAGRPPRYLADEGWGP